MHEVSVVVPAAAARPWTPQESDVPITRVVERLLGQYLAGNRLHLSGSPRVGLPEHVPDAIAAAGSGKPLYVCAGRAGSSVGGCRLPSPRGMRADAGQMLVTDSAMHALDLVFRSIPQPGDEVLIAGPGFFIGGLVRRAGATLAALTGWVDTMIAAAGVRGARLVGKLDAFDRLGGLPPLGGLNLFPRFTQDGEQLARDLVVLWRARLSRLGIRRANRAFRFAFSTAIATKTSDWPFSGSGPRPPKFAERSRRPPPREDTVKWTPRIYDLTRHMMHDALGQSLPVTNMRWCGWTLPVPRRRRYPVRGGT